MPIVFTDADGRVDAVHHRPDDLTDEHRAEGHLVDALPEPEQRPGQRGVLRYTQADGFTIDYVEDRSADGRLASLEVEVSDLRERAAQAASAASNADAKAVGNAIAGPPEQRR